MLQLTNHLILIKNYPWFIWTVLVCNWCVCLQGEMNQRLCLTYDNAGRNHKQFTYGQWKLQDYTTLNSLRRAPQFKLWTLHAESKTNIWSEQYLVTNTVRTYIIHIICISLPIHHERLTVVWSHTRTGTFIFPDDIYCLFSRKNCRRTKLLKLCLPYPGSRV